MIEWVSAQLGDVVDLLTGFPFKSAEYVADPSAPRLLRGDNIGQGVLRWDGAKRWPMCATEDITQYWVREGDVVLAMDRPWIDAGLKFASVRSADLPALVVQRVARLRGTSRLDTGYLKYIVGSQAFTTHVLSIQTGTAVPHISANQIKSFKCHLPPLALQRAIANILGTLDDKIELNRRTSETLEAMAQALFKDWFIDFGPVRAKMEGRDPYLAREVWDLFPGELNHDGKPAGWRASTLGREIENSSGLLQTGPFGSQLHASDYTEDGIPVVMPKILWVEGCPSMPSREFPRYEQFHEHDTASSLPTLSSVGEAMLKSLQSSVSGNKAGCAARAACWSGLVRDGDRQRFSPRCLIMTQQKHGLLVMPLAPQCRT